MQTRWYIIPDNDKIRKADNHFGESDVIVKTVITVHTEIVKPLER